MVKPKKHLGQHFLTDMSMSEKIVEAMDYSLADSVIEIGPGTGVLTQFLAKKELDLILCEVDVESIAYLQNHYPQLHQRILNQDFLKLDLKNRFSGTVNIIGNFPYNISSQILFKAYENIEIVPQVVGMFQKEVAQRVASGPGNKTYGILSVLLQAFYDIEYLFTIGPSAFYPPPKVDSGVIRLTRNKVESLACDKTMFTRVVKAAFGMRRKTLRNALKPIMNGGSMEKLPFLTKRAEQLSVDEFIELTCAIEQS
ncbi:MAG: 16S rRNA (adenine(1518)-N(6)/adenine(1519)-N(6))-dimethyltransferase RsmA [Salibacteraceae bacterium]